MSGFAVDLDDVEVRMVHPYQATKRYVCPGCHRDIAAGIGHLVVVPRAAPDLRWAPESVDLPDSASILNLLSRPGSGWEKKVFLEKKPGESPLGLPSPSYPGTPFSGDRRTSGRISRRTRLDPLDSR